MERECDVRSLTSTGAVSRRSCCVLVATPSSDKLFLFGGVGPNAYYNDLHEFNIHNRSWAECYPIGSRPAPRGGCASALLQHRTLLVFGGRGEDGFLSDMFALDLVHLGWSPMHPAGQRPSAREDAVMSAAGPSGFVYLLGGCGVAGAEADLWRYDPTQAHWDLIEPEVAAFPNGVAAPSFAHSDHHMYIFGGYDKFGTFMNELWRFSMRDQSWNRIEIRGGVPRPRTHGQLALCDGNLLLYGGYSTGEALDDVWQLLSVSSDIASSGCLVIIGEELRLHKGVDVVLARGAAASAVAQRTLFIFGGCDGTNFLQDILAMSLSAIECTPARRQPTIHSRAWTPQPFGVVHGGPVGGEHPYNVVNSPVGETTFVPSVYALPPAADAYLSGSPTRAPSMSPTQLTSVDMRSRPVAPVGGGLMHAITDLKAELFGPRVSQVDTIMEENRKLREENAKLQQTVLDLMRKLSSSAGVPREAPRPGPSQSSAYHQPSISGALSSFAL